MAVLIGDDGSRQVLPRKSLPGRVREGMVYRVPKSTEGELRWAEAVVDDAERRRRLEAAKAVLEELRKRDPGGDVRL